MAKLYILQSEVGKLHETDNAETAMKMAIQPKNRFLPLRE